MVNAQSIDTCTREDIYLQRGDTCITGHAIHTHHIPAFFVIRLLHIVLSHCFRC